ncbi:hypothetical protein ACFL2A_03290 [Thermodesulfobacteriota bacterium]
MNYSKIEDVIITIAFFIINYYLLMGFARTKHLLDFPLSLLKKKEIIHFLFAVAIIILMSIVTKVFPIESKGVLGEERSASLEIILMLINLIASVYLIKFIYIRIKLRKEMNNAEISLQLERLVKRCFLFAGIAAFIHFITY